MYQSFGVDER
jgi:hypothetical protein